jgi:CO dehydrogenase nickel-insertion accessory protein CooC1
MSESLLKQLEKLTDEIEDISVVMEKTETFRAFNRWLSERHVDSNIVCEINKYQDLLSIDLEGTIIKADSLLQIRYTDEEKKTKN